MKNREIVYPERSAKIAEVGKVQTFSTREGDTMYGAEIALDNGDTFSHWTMDRNKLSMFKEGAYLIYKLKKVIENEGTDKEKVKTKLDEFDFILPRKVRAEMDIARKLLDNVSFSLAYAKDILEANPSLYINGDGEFDEVAFKRNLSAIAYNFRECGKALLISEDFGDVAV